VAISGVVSMYPLPVFSRTSLSAAVRAFSGVGNFFVCVCPSVPILPNVTVKLFPCSSMFQNLCDLPSLSWNVRIAASLALRSGLIHAGVVRAAHAASLRAV
jgi:hypothetical protein